MSASRFGAVCGALLALALLVPSASAQFGGEGSGDQAGSQGPGGAWDRPVWTGVRPAPAHEFPGAGGGVSDMVGGGGGSHPSGTPPGTQPGSQNPDCMQGSVTNCIPVAPCGPGTSCTPPSPNPPSVAQQLRVLRARRRRLRAALRRVNRRIRRLEWGSVTPVAESAGSSEGLPAAADGAE